MTFDDHYDPLHKKRYREVPMSPLHDKNGTFPLGFFAILVVCFDLSTAYNIYIHIYIIMYKTSMAYGFTRY